MLMFSLHYVILSWSISTSFWCTMPFAAKKFGLLNFRPLSVLMILTLFSNCVSTYAQKCCNFYLAGLLSFNKNSYVNLLIINNGEEISFSIKSRNSTCFSNVNRQQLKIFLCGRKMSRKGQLVLFCYRANSRMSFFINNNIRMSIVQQF